MKKIKSYTGIWNVEKVLYAINDFNLPFPVTFTQITWFVITVYHDCKIMIDVARQKLMNDPTFKHLSEDCQEYYFDFEAYASHLQEHGKFLVTEHGIFELPE